MVAQQGAAEAANVSAAGTPVRQTPRPRSGIETAAAIRRGEIRIGSPVPMWDAYDGDFSPAAGVPTPSPGFAAAATAAVAAISATPPPAAASPAVSTSAGDIRPRQQQQQQQQAQRQQSPQIPAALYDGRPPPTSRGGAPMSNYARDDGGVDSGVNSGGGSDFRGGSVRHPRAGKSVELYPTQKLVRRHPKRSSLRIKPAAAAPSPSSTSLAAPTTAEPRRSSSMMRARPSFDTSGDDEGLRELGKDARRGSGSLKAVFRKVFRGGAAGTPVPGAGGAAVGAGAGAGGNGAIGGVVGVSRRGKDDPPFSPRRPLTSGRDGPEKQDWADTRRFPASRDGTTRRVNQFGGLHDPIMNMPVREITPKTPLGNSLPFPMNVNAPQESPPRASTGRMSQDAATRRATLPSLALSQGDFAALSSMWEQDSQEASAEPGSRRSRSPAPDIGMAITSAGALSTRRRSRSADALGELAKERKQMEEQQSDSKQVEDSHTAETESWFNGTASNAADSRKPSGSDENKDLTRKQSAESSNNASMKTAPAALSGDEVEVEKVEQKSRASPKQEPREVEQGSTHAEQQPAKAVTDRPTNITRATGSVRELTRNFSRPARNEELVPERDSLVVRLDKLEHWVQKLREDSQRSTVVVDSSRSPSASEGEHADRKVSETKAAPLHEAAVEENTQTPQQSQPVPPSQQPTVSTAASTAANAAPSQSPRSPPKTDEPPRRRPSDGSGQRPLGMYIPTDDEDEQAPTTPSRPAKATEAVSSSQRPETSHAMPSSLPSPNMYDHLAPLYAALRYERSKRKEAEAQMARLQQSLSDLTALVRTDRHHPPPYGRDYAHDYGYIYHHDNDRGGRAALARAAAGGAYPTPSPEDAFGAGFSSDEQQQQAAAAVAAMHQRSRFSGLDYDSSCDYDDDDDDDADDADDDSNAGGAAASGRSSAANRRILRGRMRISRLRNHYGDADNRDGRHGGGGEEAEDDNDDGRDEVYDTPTEFAAHHHNPHMTALAPPFPPPAMTNGQQPIHSPRAYHPQLPYQQQQQTSSPSQYQQRQPSNSKIPTPKQSLKNLRSASSNNVGGGSNAAAGGGPVRNQPSASSLAQSVRSGSGSMNSLPRSNRFGFPGGKM